MKLVKIPERVDDSPHMLLWSMDELVPPIIFFLAGMILLDAGMRCMLVGFLVSYVYRRFRESKPDGYLLHMLYWHGIPMFRSGAMLNPFIKRFFP
jgi:conjugal transfer pilus assembly protein TraL